MRISSTGALLIFAFGLMAGGAAGIPLGMRMQAADLAGRPEAALRGLRDWLRGDEPAVPRAADLRPRIRCAPDGRRDWAPDCRLERLPGGAIALYKPGGGFRRLALRGGEAPYAAADGAEAAALAPQPGAMTAVRIGADRFLLPADPARLPGRP